MNVLRFVQQTICQIRELLCIIAERESFFKVERNARDFSRKIVLKWKHYE
jgi:hypothetical protein